MVSVIIPIYNVAPFLGRCLDSVLQQSYHDLEVVMVDDASTDLSLDIAQAYKEQHPSHFRIIRHEENKGLMTTRRDGYMVAKGDFVLFLDADDALPDDAIEKLVEEQQLAEADIVMGHLLKRFVDGHTQCVVGCLDRKEATRLEVLSALLTCSMTHSLCGKLFKTTLFRQGALQTFDHLTIAEDGCLLYQLVAKAVKLASVDSVVYDYYENKASTTQHAYRTEQISSMMTAYGVIAHVCSPYASLHLLLAQRLTKVAFTFYVERVPLHVVRRLLRQHGLLPYGSVRFALKYLTLKDFWFFIKRFIYVRTKLQ